MNGEMIGIVGGVGSYAGIDLIRKIYDETKVACDQQHLPISLISVPHRIVDRTAFLLGKTQVNPGVAIAEVVVNLAELGCRVIGIPCNTAHAPTIYDLITDRVPHACKLVHMVEEVARHLQNRPEGISRVGVLGTKGTISANVYTKCLAKYGIEVIYPTEDIQDLFVHPAIYSSTYGIKACSNPVDEKATADLLLACSILSRKGAEAIVLGCTEIPLALRRPDIDGSPLIDATAVLAKALIRESIRVRT